MTTGDARSVRRWYQAAPATPPATLRAVELAGPVLDVVLPVYGLIAAGWAAHRARLIADEDVRRFTDFTFRVFVPAQLFLAMARTDFGTLQAVVILRATLPIGANVFLFAQRYRSDTSAIAAAVVWSTLLAAPILAVLPPLLPVPPR
jgi:predicted permease